MRLSTALLICCVLNPAIALTQLDSYGPSTLIANAWSGAAAALRYASSSLSSPRGAALVLRKRLIEPAYHQCVLQKKPIGAAANGSAPATWGIASQTTTTITRSLPSATESTSSVSSSSSSGSSSSSSSSSVSTTSSSTSSSTTTTSQDSPTSQAPSTSAAPTSSSQPSPPPPPPSSSSTSSTPAAPSPSSIWNVVEAHSGQNFFDGFTFWDETVDGGDPTHGLVDYVGYQSALQQGLVGINAQQHAIMAAATTPNLPSTSSRPSVRISTARTFTGGLLIADIYHMPTGCGTWPSFWTCGPNWPQGGEIDIIEGIHEASINTASVHTNPGCYMPADYGGSGSLLTQGPTGLDCSAADTNDAGCGIIANGSNTYGVGFNNAGGGVYAMQWDETGISTYFFPRGTTPGDITSGYPNPGGWGQPVGHWPSTSCNPYQYFYNHVAIFDNTLCGDWAGPAWASSVMGQSGTCAQITGYSNCNDYVLAQGAAFASAYWEVASVTLYQKAGQGA